MNLDIQFKLKNNPNYLKYIRTHSYWYRILIREPSLFKQFEEEVKEVYGLRPTDRIGKALDTIQLFQNLLTSLK